MDLRLNERQHDLLRRIVDGWISDLKMEISDTEDFEWQLRTIKNAGSAEMGRRQAHHITTSPSNPRSEFDAWLTLR